MLDEGLDLLTKRGRAGPAYPTLLPLPRRWRTGPAGDRSDALAATASPVTAYPDLGRGHLAQKAALSTGRTLGRRRPPGGGQGLWRVPHSARGARDRHVRPAASLRSNPVGRGHCGTHRRPGSHDGQPSGVGVRGSGGNLVGGGCEPWPFGWSWQGPWPSAAMRKRIRTGPPHP